MTGYVTAMHTVADVTLTLDLQLCTRVTGDGKGAHTSVVLPPQMGRQNIIDSALPLFNKNDLLFTPRIIVMCVLRRSLI